MDPHLSLALGHAELIAGDDLQQPQQCKTIAEVLVNILDLDPDLPQVRVAPGCEGLGRTGACVCVCVCVGATRVCVCVFHRREQIFVE